MTHDIYFVETRTNKQKQKHVLLYVNDGCGLKNCNKQQEKYLCFKGKDMYFRWRPNQDQTGLDHGLDHRKKSLKVKKKSKNNRL